MTGLESFRTQIEKELKDNILPFWIDHSCDNANGGFYGYISRDNKADAYHDKAAVLNARILWTFSSAYRIFRDKKYLDMAVRAYDYFKPHFIDVEYSGVYWMLNFKGEPIDAKKQVYAVAFAIYGLSEYGRATGNREALTLAAELFETLEKNARDEKYGGYIEALGRDWTPISDMSLSAKDLNVPKSMNTHLHILEAYTGLLRVWDSPKLKTSLAELLNNILEHIVDHEEWCFKLFFSMDWAICNKAVSYGHDIEGSWLICEAAEVLGDPVLLEKTVSVAVKMVESVLRNGKDSVFGGIFNERQGSFLDDGKDWWPQAESVVGFYNAYQLTGNEIYFNESQKVWEFIQKYLADRRNGEWFWGVTRDGTTVTSDEKASSWKCPYHNSRMCFEIIGRIGQMTQNDLE